MPARSSGWDGRFQGRTRGARCSGCSGEATIRCRSLLWRSPAISPARGRCGDRGAGCAGSGLALPFWRVMLYRWKVRSLKIRRVNVWWRRWRARRGETIGNYDQLPGLIRRYAPGKSFADIGCMWGVNGEYAFVAEEAGAIRVKAVDVFGPTPEFEEKRHSRQSRVEFILGDITRAGTLASIGVVD